MSSIHDLEDQFDAAQRQRGAEYFAEGRVDIVTCSDQRVTALVRGMQAYPVRLEAAKSGWTMSCTCPAFGRDFACKIW